MLTHKLDEQSSPLFVSVTDNVTIMYLFFPQNDSMPSAQHHTKCSKRGCRYWTVNTPVAKANNVTVT